MGLLNSNSLNQWFTQTIPQNARNLWGEIKQAPQDMRNMFTPETYKKTMDAYKNPKNGALDKDKAIAMAMDFLQTTNPIAGIGGMFIGKGAKNFDFLKAKEAEDMLSKGVDIETVRKKTGMLKGPEGALRQEIPDNTSFYRGSKAAGSSYADEVFLHPELYENYPFLKSLRVIESPNNGGMYDEIRRQVTVGPTDAGSTMLHELQHAIQQHEGWAVGGSPKEFTDLPTLMKRVRENSEGLARANKAGGVDELTGMNSDFYTNNLSGLKEQADFLLAHGGTPDSAYRDLAGEMESRLTQKRGPMTMAQRMESNPYGEGMIDVPYERLIVRGHANEVMNKPTGLLSYADEAKKAQESSGLLGRYGAKPDDVADELAKERALRVSSIKDDYRLPNLHNAVPKEYLPKQYGKKTVTVYRGVPSSVKDATIRPGDWVSLDKKYASQHGTGETGKSKVISMEVPAESVGWAGTDMNEWFYVPKDR